MLTPTPDVLARRSSFKWGWVIVLLAVLAATFLAPATVTINADGASTPSVQVTSWPRTIKFDRPKRAEGVLRGERIAYRTVQLQRRLPGGVWTTIAKDVTNSSGRWSILIKPRFYHAALPHRIVVGDSTVASYSNYISVRAEYLAKGSGRDWAPIDGNTVFQYNPCSVVRYRVNTNGLGPSALRDVRTALGRVSRASGLTFKYVGSTRKIYLDGKTDWPANTELVISWGSDKQITNSFKNAAAWGGVDKAEWATSATYGQVASITQSGVVMDRNATYMLRGSGPEVPGKIRRVQLLQHEIGHAMGLGHVSNSPRQVMGVPSHAEFYGAGDLTGFRKLGRPQGCLTPDAALGARSFAPAPGLVLPPMS